MRTLSILFIALCCTIKLLAQNPVLIRDVNVVDVSTGKTNHHQFIFIKNDRIESITGKTPSVPNNTTIVEAKGKFIIPGLWDMHGHTQSAGFYFPLLICNGVTGVRDMFDDIKLVREWRTKIQNGELLGPVIYASGPIVDGPQPIWPGSAKVGNAEQGRKVVDSVKNLGVDFIKVYSLLSEESYYAIADEAKKQNMVFAGHVPNRITVLEAAQAGQKSMEHMYGFLEIASDSADYYFDWQKKKITDTSLQNKVYREAFLQRNFNPKKFQTAIQALAKYDSWQCPTLVVNRSIAYLTDTTFTNDPRLVYMGAGFKQRWDPKNDFRFAKAQDELYILQRKAFKMKMDMILPMYKAGIKFIAGTDYPNPYVFPGFSLHDELALFVEAGLTPLQALQTATINPATYFGITKDYGGVQAGKIADLVILDANPLENISNTKKINTVIVHGKVLQQETLQNMLNAAKKKL
ncbi:imidazolonepropionase-like amidohydrolase [Chitinophaga skermanii]|uniref:Imidazolonepropionase-like amidohydrolase n=1 Tax=Chitinophaga skermanii TaxID=331697 RepID=A0A327QCG9_9BACT|nr:amidohydrolase family protein [Chitinophaga skermanii]RAI99406.1 imidazolonepropionase-like amidohydrolase [Chitinophaga skermanii]